MIDVDEALEILFSKITPLDTVRMNIGDALYRTLAQAVLCDIDAPPFDRAVMDGYAVRSHDVAAAPVTLRVVGQIAAGTTSDTTLHTGEVMQINTGAPIPPGADAVVRVEFTQPGASSNEVLIRESVPAGRFITRRATYVSAGDVVLKAGVRLTPLEIATAVAAGAGSVTVYRKPTVSILPTGDELVEVDAKPRGGQIRNSNKYLLSSLVASAHAEPVVLETAVDDRAVLHERIVAGLRADVLCVTGGVSMGAFDFVPEVLKACGAVFHIEKMAIKPGRPTIFATTPDGTLIFALPGNPASAWVGFELLVRPALAALEGRGGIAPLTFRATLVGTLKHTTNRRTYVPARASIGRDGGWEVEALSWHGSGDSFGMATAHGLIVRPPEADDAKSGDAVSFLLLDRC